MKRVRYFNILIILLSVVLLTGCVRKIQKPMVLSVSLWIGYAPLYYAYEEGWLRKNGIKFVANIPSGQNIEYYKKGAIDIFAGANYEYVKSKKFIKDLTAVKLLDVSKGGDSIYSNRDIDELKKSPKIDVYLEVESINYMLLKKFIKRYGFRKEQINLIDSPIESELNIEMKKNPVLVVSYKPYDKNLKKAGYRVVATAQSLKFTIFDALFVSKEYAVKHKEKIKKLKHLFDAALEELRENPYDFYIVINPYYGYKSYSNFKNDLKSISWKSDKSLNFLMKQSEEI